MDENIAPDLEVTTDLKIEPARAIEAVKMANDKKVDATDAYNNLDTFKQADKIQKPIPVPPTIKDYVQRSPANAAIIKGDESTWSKVAKEYDRTWGALFSAATSTPLQQDLSRRSAEFMLKKHDKNGVLSTILGGSDKSQEDLALDVLDIQDRINSNPQYLEADEPSFSAPNIAATIGGFASQVVDTALEYKKTISNICQPS